MIRNFKHRGLKKLYLNDDPTGVPQQLVERLELVLGRLDAADSVLGMYMPGYRLHPLKGSLKGYWSVTVSGNMRLIFRFDDRNNEVFDVDLVDYH